MSVCGQDYNSGADSASIRLLEIVGQCLYWDLSPTTAATTATGTEGWEVSLALSPCPVPDWLLWRKVGRKRQDQLDGFSSSPLSSHGPTMGLPDAACISHRWQGAAADLGCPPPHSLQPVVDVICIGLLQTWDLQFYWQGACERWCSFLCTVSV